MNPSIPRSIRPFFLTCGSSLVMLSLSVALAEAQPPPGPPTEPQTEAPAPTPESAETEVRTFSPQERRELKEWLRQWQDRREDLFEQLVDLVGQGDRLQAYEVLKELHGGGAGIAGSKFELLRMKAQEEEKRLAEMKKRRELLARMNTAEAGLPPKEKQELENRLGNLDRKIEQREKELEELEERALYFADQSVVSELPMVFELLGGSDETPREPEQQTVGSRDG